MRIEIANITVFLTGNWPCLFVWTGVVEWTHCNNGDTNTDYLNDGQ